MKNNMIYTVNENTPKSFIWGKRFCLISILVGILSLLGVILCSLDAADIIGKIKDNGYDAADKGAVFGAVLCGLIFVGSIVGYYFAYRLQKLDAQMSQKELDKFNNKIKKLEYGKTKKVEHKNNTKHNKALKKQMKQEYKNKKVG